MKKLIIIWFVILTKVVSSQPPSKFNTAFGGNGEDIGYSCKQTLDGNYIIAGSSSSSGFGQTDVYLLKMDSMGQPLWWKYIGGFGNEIAKSVVQLADSGFVVCGYTSSFGAGGYDIYLIRTDKNGNLIWQKTFGGQEWDFGNDLLIAADGNIVLVGHTSSFGSGKKDGCVIKCDLAGNLIWQKLFGGLENEELNSVINTNDNFLGIVGYTESATDILGDFYFLKIDLNGDTIFTKTYGNPGKSYLSDLIHRPTGEYILVGAETYTDSPYTKSYMGNLIESTGTFTWQGSYYASSEDEFWASVTKSIYGTPRVSYLRTVPVPAFGMQGNIFSSIGSTFFPNLVSSYGEYGDEYAFAHEGTRDGGFICVGSTTSFSGSDKDVFIIKLDSTITSSTQLVGLKQENMNHTITEINVNDFFVEVNFNSSELAKSIEIIDFDGKSLLTILHPEENVIIDKAILKNSLALFKFNFSDHSFITQRVLVR